MAFRFCFAVALAVAWKPGLLCTLLAAPRVVLFEEQTSETCEPCATANPIVQSVLDSYGAQVAAVKWHVWWPSPGNDRWYLHDPPAGAMARRLL